MFPHTITLFSDKGASGVYKSTKIDNVLWYGNKGIVLNGKGIEDSDSINIIIPKEKIPENVRFKKGDSVVKGICEDISSLNELSNNENTITITTINNYDLGTNLDCILIGGK